jgi:endonuclease/exonuclease/phosphatase family metal-dependent hydrolase
MKNISLLTIVILMGCEPFVSEFDDVSDAIMYEASSKTSADVPDKVKVVTWNIRFGIGRFPFFGDSCGDSVILDNQSIGRIMSAIADTLTAMDPDIVLIQEADVNSKRTGYMDQVQYLLDNTNLNYGCYGSMWKADYIMSDGIGRVDAGNAILSKFELTDAERIPLRLRGDQDPAIQYFYLRRNIVKAKIPELAIGASSLFAVNIHATAFATDDTKEQHINTYISKLAEIHDAGDYFVTGGDLNSVPPGAETDYCLSDMCDGDNYHTDDALDEHKEASYFENFEGEPDILLPLYNAYDAAIDSSESGAQANFTHAPSTSYAMNNIKYDRKLDYLFTNRTWVDSLSHTHQGSWELSDHMPVSSAIDMGVE